MDQKTAHILSHLTSDFYERNAASFSATRSRAWDGWIQCMPYIGEPQRVLDFGCGNLRFETFLEENLTCRPEVWAIDNCPVLLGDYSSLHFQQLDIVDTLLSKNSLATMIEAPQCDLTCAFGLIHHIPTASARMELLDVLIDKTSPQGLVIVALWQFARDIRLLNKARTATQEALKRYPDLMLDEGDYLMGWQDSTETFRYCHSFSDADVDALIAHAQNDANLVTRFCADGKSGNLNCYLVFRKVS